MEYRPVTSIRWEDTIKQFIWHVFVQSIAGAIVLIGIVVVAYAITGKWPPKYLLVSSSIGGGLSPFVWRIYRAVYPLADVRSAELSRQSRFFL